MASGHLWLSLALAPVPTSQPTAPQLVWEAPADCPNRAWLVTRTEDYLGASVSQPRDEPFELRATVTRSAEAYDLHLVMRAGGGTTDEHHETASCDEAAKLVAIKVALTLDSEAFISRYDEVEAEAEVAKERALGPEPVPVPVPEQPNPPEERAPAPPAPPPGSPPDPQRRKLTGFLALGGGVGAGILPGATGLMSLSGGFAGESWRAEFRGAFWTPKSARFDEAPDVGAHLLAGGGAVLGCLVPQLSIVELPVCAGAEVLAVRAAGVGTPEDGTATRVAPSVVAGAGAVFRWRRWGFFLRPEAGVTLSSPVFEVDGLGTIHTVARVTGRLTAGAELHFGG